MDSQKTGMNRILYTVIFLALLAGGTYYLIKNNEAKGNVSSEETARTYSSAEYGFTFSYDPTLVLLEFTPRYLTLEDQTRAEPNEIVQIAVETEDALEVPETFSQYVQSRAINYCAADGPGGSMKCTKVTRSEPFVGESGASGDVFYLEFVHETFAEGGGIASSTTREAGPFYAFELSRGEGDSAFAALIVRPANFFSEGELYDMGAAAAFALVETLVLQGR